ncbi:MAG: NAD(P)/FAD-dependent oxidoreductase [Bryobacteraceae bacterium]|nr:NAD(P)/FAD-dependent oxidoreductase [Bryobacteraceae bacterium]
MDDRDQLPQLTHPLPAPPHHVVIVGGGFAGLYAAKELGRAPVRVTLIDKRNFHLFQPLLYQVATGSLSPGEIAAPLRATLRDQRNTQVLMEEVTGIDAARRRLYLANAWIEYDSLILGTGAANSYFGNPWETVAPGLKSLEDATEMRQRILYAFEAAEKEPDSEIRRQWLTFVIVGGGPTGVELAGALGEIANETLRRDFRLIRPQEAQILLIDASPRILSSYAPELSDKAERFLMKLGVRTRTGVRVTSIDEQGLSFRGPDGVSNRIATRTVLWAAGVQASSFTLALAESTGARLDRAGRVQVEPDLTLKGHPEIFATGDMVTLTQDGQPVPGVCPAAMQMGRYAARRIVDRIKADRLNGRAASSPFRYHDKGSLAVIGRAAAVAQFGAVRMAGHFAWLAWLFIHIMYLVGFQNRVLVFIQWGFQYLTFSRGARLITGVQSPPASSSKSG